MLFNSYTFLVFFIIVLILAQSSVFLEDEKNQPADCELYFLCCMESSVYSAVLALYPRRLFCRQGVVHAGK